MVLALIAVLIRAAYGGAPPQPARARMLRHRRTGGFGGRRGGTVAFFAAAYLLPGIVAGAWPHALPALQPAYVAAMLGVSPRGCWSPAAGRGGRAGPPGRPWPA